MKNAVRFWPGQLALWVILAGTLTTVGTGRAGTWTPLANGAPSEVELMLLLTDGTVMAANQPAAGSDVGQAWYRLTPDSQGSYVNGTWTTLASMHDTRLYYSSAVLRDGRVFVAGGEYGSGRATAEVYDPASDTWTLAPPSGQGFSDSISKILPNGNVLIAPVFPGISGGTVTYDPAANNWLMGPKLFRGVYQDEASWVKLPDDSILTIDPFGTASERYIPSLNRWINDATVPVALYNNIGELGAAFLLPDGRAFFLGGTLRTAFYTPSGTTNAGTWAAGPDAPGGLGVSDAAAAMLVNGKILCAFGSPTNYNAPTYFYEFDPVANSFAPVSGPAGAIDDVPPYTTMMLDLPDGTVLYSHFGTHLYVYQPDGAPLASAKPVISSVTQNPDGSYHVIGTLLNGISEGAAYGDDAQMNSNYPLVRMTNNDGNVYYARTYNFSSTSVMTGNRLLSAEFTLPADLPPGTNSLVVVANGISSDALAFTPGALKITPASGVAARGPVGGPFSPSAQTFTLTNAGTAPLNWSVVNTSVWLNVAPSSGTLTPGDPATLVSANLNSRAANLFPGVYTATVVFNNLTDGATQARQFSLQVAAPDTFQPYSSTVMSLNPAGYWRLNETNQPPTGGTATNLGTLGATADGSYGGLPAWIAGALAGSTDLAASFNGGSSMTVPYIAALSLNPPFTVEAWVRPAVAQTSGNVACAVACGHFASSRSGWLIYQSPTGWNFRMYDQNGLNTSLNIETGGAPVPGVWYHVVAVYDGATGSIYVNGAGVSGTPSGFVANVDGPLTIGARSDSSFFFNGAIDEMALYSTALMPAEILTHYQNGTNSSPATPYNELILAKNPIAYFRLDPPGVLPVALNSGSLGAVANGIYEAGAVPGVPGVPIAGFGANNYACQFNGLAGYVDIPGASLNFTGPVSLMAWVKANPADGLLQTIVGKGDTSYRLDLNANGYPGFSDGQQSIGDLLGSARVDDGQWHHLVGVYNGLASEWLYVDGQLAAATSSATTPVAGNTRDLWLGAAPDYGTARTFSGAVDEVAIFNTALAPAQIAQIYRSAFTTPPVFQSITYAGGTVTLTWSAIAGRIYQLQFKTDFMQTDWVNLGSPATATNSAATSSDSTRPDLQRVYRVVLLP